MTGPSQPELEVIKNPAPPHTAERQTSPNTIKQIGNLLSRPGRRTAAIGLVTLAAVFGFAENVDRSDAVNFPDNIPEMDVARTKLHEPTASSSAASPSDGRLKIPKIIIDYANAPSGYAIGNLTDNDTFVYSGIKVKDIYGRTWKYGEMNHLGEPSDDDCGWIKAREVKDIKAGYSENICADKLDELKDRKSIGDAFNCDDHTCDDGKFTRTLKSCDHSLALNYNEKKMYSYDILPLEIPNIAYFRYLNNDHTKKWSRVEIQVPGRNADEGISVWTPVPGSCIAGIPKGGPENPALDIINQR